MKFVFNGEFRNNRLVLFEYPKLESFVFLILLLAELNLSRLSRKKKVTGKFILSP